MGDPLLIFSLVANGIGVRMDPSKKSFIVGQWWNLLMSSSIGLCIHTVPMLASYFNIMFPPRAARFDRYKLQTYSSCIYSVDIFEGMGGEKKSKDSATSVTYANRKLSITV